MENSPVVPTHTMADAEEMKPGEMPVARPPKCAFPRINSAIATSSRLALPARSPMPLMVHSA